MRNRTDTLTLAAVAATLTLAGCTDNGPGSVIEADEEPTPGDPAVFAPDGWPLQIGDTLAPGQEIQLQKDFLRYGLITGMHLVGDQVYGARYRFGSDLSVRIYEGHFPKRAYTKRENEHRLPPEFHGKVEYYPPPVEEWYINADGERRLKHNHPPGWETGAPDWTGEEVRDSGRRRR